MEEQHNEFKENGPFDAEKLESENGTVKTSRENTGNQDFFNREEFAPNATTGSGLSEAERNFQDGTNNDLRNDHHDDGSEQLVDRYNINDKAHSDSSLDDFVNTTSNFHHADEPGPDDSPERDSTY